MAMTKATVVASSISLLKSSCSISNVPDGVIRVAKMSKPYATIAAVDSKVAGKEWIDCIPNT
jgi:hypothetical protein